MSTRRWLALVACGAMTLGMTACGGDDDATSSATGGTTTATTSGAPVKVMIITAIGTPGADRPNVPAAAKAAAAAINAQGGVKGRPIEILECNDKGGDNGTAACARKAGAEKVVAVIPNNTYGGSLFPTLEQSEIPAIATNAAVADDLTSPMSFPITPGTQVRNLASPTAVKQQGGKSVVGMVSDLSTAKEQLAYMKRGAKLAGLEYEGDIIVPLDATDYAPYVQQLKNSGADAAILGFSPQQVAPVAQNAKQLGMDTKFVHGSTTIRSEVVQQLEQIGVADNFLVLSYLPPPGTEAMAPYRAELDAAADAGSAHVGEGDRGLDSQLAWLGVHAFAQAAGNVQGELTNTSLLAYLNSKPRIPLLDGALTWDLGKVGTVAETPRLTNGDVYVNKPADGDITLLSPEPIDGLALLEQG